MSQSWSSWSQVLDRVAPWRDASLLRRLDRLPLRPALAVGVVVGLGLGTLAWFGGTLGWTGLAVVLVLAALLALTAEPMWQVRLEETEPTELLDMVAIAGGSFLMGSRRWDPRSLDDEKPRHRVTVSAFRMARTPVTRGQHKEIVGGGEAADDETKDHPVTEVSWFDAVQFCNRLSQRDGFSPCYKIDGKQVECDFAVDGYRLPTEAEWEYATRAGTRTSWSFGDSDARIGEYAWFAGNSKRQIQPVAKLQPNPWGLYDLHGNVWEWCWDRYGPYKRGPVTDPTGPSVPSSGLRVLRGGAFWYEPRVLRSANRVRREPRDRCGDVGFRCVRRPRPQP